MVDFAEQRQPVTEWTDGQLVLALEQKKITVPHQACPRFINGLFVWDELFLFLQLFPQSAHPASPSTHQQANPIRHKGLVRWALTNYLNIWDIMSVGQLVGGWRGWNEPCVTPTTCMSCVNRAKPLNLRRVHNPVALQSVTPSPRHKAKSLDSNWMSSRWKIWSCCVYNPQESRAVDLHCKICPP